MLSIKYVINQYVKLEVNEFNKKWKRKMILACFEIEKESKINKNIWKYKLITHESSEFTYFPLKNFYAGH